MKLSVTTWQRVMLVQIVGNMRGNLLRIRKANKALDVLELSDKEKEQVGYLDLPDGSSRWQDTEHRWDLEIKDKEAAHLVKVEAKRFADWPASMAEQVFDLAEQVGIKFEEDKSAQGVGEEDQP